MMVKLIGFGKSVCCTSHCDKIFLEITRVNVCLELGTRSLFASDLNVFVTERSVDHCNGFASSFA